MDAITESAPDSNRELEYAVDNPLFEASPDGIAVVDVAGTMVAVNKTLADMLGYAPADLVGTPVSGLIPHELRPVHEAHLSTYVGQPRSRAMASGLRLLALHRDGSQVPVDIALSPFQADGSTYTIASIRDSTARLAAEQAASQADELHSIMRDRQRIARDLHDTVIQDIFAAGMGLQALQKQISNDEQSAQLGASVTHLDNVITRLRKVVFNLTQGDESEPIGEAAERVITEALGASTLDVGVTVKVESGPLPARTQEHVLATLQEAVSNVVRHADATRADVLIEATDVCRLRVEDDGKGMPDAAATRPGFGLTNMMNRAQVLGGSCDISEAENGGTVLEWVVPL